MTESLLVALCFAVIGYSRKRFGGRELWSNNTESRNRVQTWIFLQLLLIHNYQHVLAGQHNFFFFYWKYIKWLQRSLVDNEHYYLYFIIFGTLNQQNFTCVLFGSGMWRGVDLISCEQAQLNVTLCMYQIYSQRFLFNIIIFFFLFKYTSRVN